jgi:PmbA protein
MTLERGIGPLKEHRWARETAQRLVAAAKAAGADACDATVGVGAQVSARAREGEIEHVSRSSSRGAGVRVLVGGRLGFATAAAAPKDERGIAELAKSAVALARISSPSEHNVIPEATAQAPEDELDAAVARLSLWDADVAGADAGWAAEQALLMERVLAGTRGIVTVRDVGAGTSWGLFGLATSTGFVGSYAGTSASLSASGVADDAGGKKQVAGWWDAARRFSALQSPELIAKIAGERALARVGAKKVKSTRAPVIFDPVMAKGLFGALLGAINGDAVARNASFLSDKLGEVILTPGIVMKDDPSVSGAFGSRPFDDEGLRVSPMTLVDEEGRLRTWLLDARSARRLGMAPTGHASRSSMSMPYPSSSNVEVLGGTGDLDSIVKETARGLLVTSLLGHGPDMITGEYSRAASGFWVEDGQIVHPVEEVTIAGHMLEMLMGLDRVGKDLDTRSSLHAPSLRFAELAISGA